MKILKRYLKVYKVFFHLNFAMLVAYRTSFINSVIAHTFWSTFVIVSMLLLTTRVSNVFGWSRNELLILAGTYNVLYSIFYFFFSRNLNDMARTLHLGRLDGVLAKPIDSQFLISCTYLNYSQIVRLALGIGFLIFMLGQMGTPITAVTLLIFLFLIIVSIIIIYSISFIVMTLTVWFTNLSNLSDFLYQMNHFARYPQEMYQKTNSLLFITLFPLTLIITIPAKALLQKVTVEDIILVVIFAIGLFVFSRKFWQFALRSYTSASG